MPAAGKTGRRTAPDQRCAQTGELVRQGTCAAGQALSAGLVSEVVPASELGLRVSEIAAGVAAQSPAAVQATVAALRRRHRAVLGPQLAQAWADVARQQAHPDAAEGARALAEKRPARWDQPRGSGEQDSP